MQESFLSFRENNRFFSTQLIEAKRKKRSIEEQIEPWNPESTQKNQAFPKREYRVNTMSLGCREHKRSMDEKIEEMYKKYGGDNPDTKDCFEAKYNNSRQVYRKKLDWLEKGDDFKQLGGGKKNFNWDGNLNGPQLQLIKMKNIYSFYNLQDHILEDKKDNQSVSTTQYRCNRNFQRMLKLKDKIRKKNNHAVQKDRQKYNQQYQSTYPRSQRESSALEVSAKATLERNKLKLKMRGLSRDNVRRTEDQRNRIQVVGTCSNAHQYSPGLDGLNLTHYSGWKNQFTRSGRGCHESEC